MGKSWTTGLEKSLKQGDVIELTDGRQVSFYNLVNSTMFVLSLKTNQKEYHSVAKLKRIVKSNAFQKVINNPNFKELSEEEMKAIHGGKSQFPKVIDFYNEGTGESVSQQAESVEELRVIQKLFGNEYAQQGYEWIENNNN